jgi:3-mercaptopyruvate sulfurtransferase SseA
VAQYLKYRGFPDVRVLAGGYPAWLAARFPTESAAGES